MTAHVDQTEIERLAAAHLSTTESPRAQRHLFRCETCLRRLIDLQARVAARSLTECKRLTRPIQPRVAVAGA
jgi:hypothetical protein